MTRSIALVLLGLLLVLYSGLACTSKHVEPPVTSEHGYTVTLRVYERRLWLGPRHLGDPRPHITECIVEVRDMQGHRVEGVPVAFQVAPSWVQNATLLPQHTLTHNGMARAVLEPHTTGVVRVMAEVNGQTQETVITVSPRNFGVNTAK